MGRHLRVRWIVAGTAVVLPVLAGCGEPPPNAVKIDAVVDDTGQAGTFIAEGDQVCPEGTWENVDPAPDGEIGIVPTRNRYRCADGSGVFVIEVTGQIDSADGIQPIVYSGTWTIDGGGLGGYSSATGSGTLSGVTGPEWLETYDGELDGG